MRRLANGVSLRSVICAMLILVLSSMTGNAETRADGCDAAALREDNPTGAAAEEILSVGRLLVPRDHPQRTTSRLTMSPGVEWGTTAQNGTLLLRLDAGVVCVSLSDGVARIARAREPLLGLRRLDDLGSGDGAILWAGDRLVVHGGGTLSVRGGGGITATATVIRVATAIPYRAIPSPAR